MLLSPAACAWRNGRLCCSAGSNNSAHSLLSSRPGWRERQPCAARLLAGDASMGLPRITEVLRAVCEPTDGNDPCKASGPRHGHGDYAHGKCSHISANLQVVYNLARPEGLLGVNSVCTAKLCAWNKPGDGSSYPETTLLANIPFTRPDRERAQDRLQAPSNSASRRASINPRVHPLLNTRGNSARVAARARFYAAANETYKSGVLLADRKAKRARCAGGNSN